MNSFRIVIAFCFCSLIIWTYTQMNIRAVILVDSWWKPRNGETGNTKLEYRQRINPAGTNHTPTSNFPPVITPAGFINLPTGPPTENVHDTLAYRTTTGDVSKNYTTLERGTQRCNWTNGQLLQCENTVSNVGFKHTMNDISAGALLRRHSSIRLGGHWMPENCKPIQSVAIIVPFRDRASHLRILLNNLHSFLKLQGIEYRIVVVEQVANQQFNRASLMNVGYQAAKNLSKCGLDCLVFHDVDLIPEGPGNSYVCSDQPKQISWKQSQFAYTIPYDGYFGGVTSMRTDAFVQINGFPNLYWGWGGEDDDIYARIKAKNWTNIKPAEPIGKYEMIKHKKYAGQKTNNCRFNLLRTAKRRFKIDGLSSLRYKIVDQKQLKLYSWLLVDLLEEGAQKYIKKHRLC